MPLHWLADVMVEAGADTVRVVVTDGGLVVGEPPRLSNSVVAAASMAEENRMDTTDVIARALMLWSCAAMTVPFVFSALWCMGGFYTNSGGTSMHNVSHDMTCILAYGMTTRHARRILDI